MHSDKLFPSEVTDSIGLQFDQELMLPGHDFRSLLSEAVNRMISNDFTRLLNILYRLDVSEEKIKVAVSASTEQPASDLIADLIIKRQLEKYHSRKSFNNSEPIDDEEKW